MSLLVASHQKVDTAVSWGHPVMLVRVCVCLCVSVWRGKSRDHALRMSIIDICTCVTPPLSFKF